MSQSEKSVVVVTGAGGFIGRHVVDALGREDRVQVLAVTRATSEADRSEAFGRADVVIHLAGVNRPQDESEFEAENVGATRELCERTSRSKPPLIAYASSTQAALDNPYGRSKLRAEAVLKDWVDSNGRGRVVIFRLTNVFGKWCRPNYNSVVATFCHNLARDLPITVNDESRPMELVHVDDVTAAFLALVRGEAMPPAGSSELREVGPTHCITLGQLASTLRSLRASRESLVMPSLEGDWMRKLYGTYLSYLPQDGFAYDLQKKSDARGVLAEFMKSEQFGQIFVSRTNPGVTRGNHFHHTKTEKFLVLDGQALVRFRRIEGGEVVEYSVAGTDLRVIDIPPGWVHSIENVGSGELVTLFWASEIFDPQRPDCIFAPVVSESPNQPRLT
ncbi:NAD dependent epimerase/dehydratase family protein [mine drainage metagenome]|uniref:NAD dependent epimerase/dehydratase family protein n=1 Tax=mine drainage metagenome TaxID=410659 RepID=A0A1J5TAQ8_9ZZZZ